jgi:hypothetical protein
VICEATEIFTAANHAVFVVLQAPVFRQTKINFAVVMLFVTTSPKFNYVLLELFTFTKTFDGPCLKGRGVRKLNPLIQEIPRRRRPRCMKCNDGFVIVRKPRRKKCGDVSVCVLVNSRHGGVQPHKIVVRETLGMSAPDFRDDCTVELVSEKAEKDTLPIVSLTPLEDSLFSYFHGTSNNNRSGSVGQSERAAHALGACLQFGAN